MTAITPLRQRLIEDLQLHGLAIKTQDTYVRAVQQLAEYYHKSPDLITEEELRQYSLILRASQPVVQCENWRYVRMNFIGAELLDGPTDRIRRDGLFIAPLPLAVSDLGIGVFPRIA